MHLPTSIATHQTSFWSKPPRAQFTTNQVIFYITESQKKLRSHLDWLSYFLLTTIAPSLKTMVCGSCFNNCPFKTRWHDNLDITHERLTKAYRQLENLQTHLLTIPILRRDRSHTGLKIKTLKRVIQKREDIVDQINMCLDFDDCEICAACPY